MLQKFYTFIFIAIIITPWIVGEKMATGHDFMKPHTWVDNPTESHQTDQEKCVNYEKRTFHEDDVAFVYLKKLIQHLFNRSNLEYDKFEDLHKRKILVELSETQLQQFEEIKSPDDLHEIFKNILFATHILEEKGITTYIWRNLKDFFIFSISSETIFITLFVAIVGLLLWKYGISLKLLLILLFFSVIARYLLEYIKCNRELQMDPLIKLAEAEKKTFWESILGKNEPSKKEQIIESFKLKPLYCDPLDVFMRFSNGVFMTYLQSVIDKFAENASNLYYKFPFPINWIAIIALMLLMSYVLKLLFQYVLGAGITGYLSKTSPQPIIIPVVPSPAVEDRLSGENLVRLLDLATTASNVAASGVQEIRENREKLTVESTTIVSQLKLLDSTNIANSNKPTIVLEELGSETEQ